MPIVPGVVLLDEALHAISMATGILTSGCHINSVKFLSPLKSGESVIIEHEEQASGSIRFDIFCGTRQIVTGSIKLGNIGLDNTESQ